MVRRKPINTKKGVISPITKTTRPEKYKGGHSNLMNLTRDYIENKEKAALKNKQLIQAGVKEILEYGPNIEVRPNKIMSVGDIIKKQGEIRLKRDSITKRKYRRRKDFSANNYTVKLTESDLRLFSEFLEEQKEFGARERKMRRKLDRAAQNAEMHANRAVKKAEKATAAIKSGNTALAETHTTAANKAISSVQHDIKRLTDQTKVIGTDKAKEAAAKVSENVANTAKKAEGIINKNANHLKIKRIGKAALATGAILGTGALVASAISKKNKTEA